MLPHTQLVDEFKVDLSALVETISTINKSNTNLKSQKWAIIF